MVTTEHGMRVKLDYLLSRKEEFPRCIAGASAEPSQHVTRLLLVPGLFPPPQPLQNETFQRLHQMHTSEPQIAR